jgi:hypothetical protein
MGGNNTPAREIEKGSLCVGAYAPGSRGRDPMDDPIRKKKCYNDSPVIGR